MLNREQQQEQLIRYSEQVRTVTDSYTTLTNDVAELKKDVAFLVTALRTSNIEAQEKLDKAVTALIAADETLSTNLGTMLDREVGFEVWTRTFWHRMLWLFRGRRG